MREEKGRKERRKKGTKEEIKGKRRRINMHNVELVGANQQSPWEERVRENVSSTSPPRIKYHYCLEILLT